MRAVRFFTAGLNLLAAVACAYTEQPWVAVIHGIIAGYVLCDAWGEV